jgi:hypothetical protein
MGTSLHKWSLLVAVLLLMTACATPQRPPGEVGRDWCAEVGKEKCR